jgi:hypothetical protein
MLLLVWVALALSLFAVTTGAVVAVRRGLDVWRDLRRLERRLGDSLEGLNERVAQLAERMAVPAARAPDVERGVARLRVSLARLALLRAALAEAQAAAAGVLAVYPRK